jgi:hypothetical protein
MRSLRQPGAEIRLRVHDVRHKQQFHDRINQAFFLPGDRARALRIPPEAVRRGLTNFQDSGPGPSRFDEGDIRLVR